MSEPTTANVTTPPKQTVDALSADDEIFTLVPTVDGRTGEIVWASGTDLAEPRNSRSTSSTGLDAPLGARTPDRKAEGISVLPRDVMAASWEDIRKAMAEHERGGTTGGLPSMLPGGEIVLAGANGSPDRGVSVLPREVMAAGNMTLGITGSDLDVVARIDPDNVEDWKPLYGEHLSGFTFTLSAAPMAMDPFLFFAFRSVADGGRWRIAVLSPKMDYRYGHHDHITRTRVGSEERAVLCGPGGRACNSLAEAREHAGKWKLYTAAWMCGLNPGFSL